MPLRGSSGSRVRRVFHSARADRDRGTRWTQRSAYRPVLGADVLRGSALRTRAPALGDEPPPAGLRGRGIPPSLRSYSEDGSETKSDSVFIGSIDSSRIEPRCGLLQLSRS